MPGLVSIVTPCKNAEKWLVECYQSMASQTYPHWEWILVDDHSSDGSFRSAQRIASNDRRVHVYPNTGSGIIEALCLALDHSNGTYITRMDADDKMPPERLRWQVGRMVQSPQHTIVTGLVSYFSDQEVSQGYRQYQHWLNTINIKGLQWTNCYRECIVASPNWLMRMDELRAIGGFKGLEYPEDYDLVFRWYQHRFRLAVVPEVTLHWREHPHRTSRTSPNYQQEAFFQLKVNRFISLDYQGRPLVIWGNNNKSRLTANILQQAGLSPILHDLKNYQQIAHVEAPQLLIAVYPPEAERLQIQTYLNSLQMTEGTNWWWL